MSIFFQRLWDSILKGAKKALKVTLKLLIYIIPAKLIVAILERIGILYYISDFFSPVMVIFGLPGEASLALLLAGSVNIYASLGVISELTLTLKQITILGVMIGCAHTLPVETNVVKTLKFPIWIQLIIRIGSAIILGILMNLIWR